MKKLSKILTLILVAALVMGVLSGCAMFGVNAAKYRNAEAIKVGNEVITVGKISDAFYNYYNQYASYISQGYVTADDIFEMAVSSLYAQAIKVDNYVQNAAKVSENNAYHNAEYLTADELAYSIAYIKYLVFTSLDAEVEAQLAKDYEFGAEEAEDTSRDFTEYDEIPAGKTYADYLYSQNFVNEEMDEYFADYCAGVSKSNISADVVRGEYLSGIAAKVANLNERLDEGELPVEEYTTIATRVFNRYSQNIQDNYQLDLGAFLKNQVEDMIGSVIAKKWDSSKYATIEAGDFRTVLDSKIATMREKTLMGYELGTSFVDTIEGLSSSSYVYAIPADYANSYIYVKNILIPFTATQTNQLNHFAQQIGDTDKSSDEYKEMRNIIAAQVVATDFNSEDQEGKIENLFKLENGKVVINQDAENNALSQYLKADGSVAAEDKTQAILDLMARFNTDLAQHKALYDYVVRVNAPESYQPKWVDEFVVAAEEAYALGENSYSIGISNYGIHIVYYAGNVVADAFDFSDTNYLDTTSAAYRYFKTYFAGEQTKVLEDAFELVRTDYFANKITKTAHLDKFLKDSGFAFDFEASLKLDDAE